MKKLIVIAALVLLLFIVTLGSALAEMQMEDPALCVAGQWLTVQYAKPASAVTVSLPAGVSYGKNGGCYAPQPAGSKLIKKVSVQPATALSGASSMLVKLDGGKASTPTVTAAWNGQVRSVQNDGSSVLVLQFTLY